MTQILMVVEVEQNLIAGHLLKVDVIMYRRGLLLVRRAHLRFFNLHSEGSRRLVPWRSEGESAQRVRGRGIL